VGFVCRNEPVQITWPAVPSVEFYGVRGSCPCSDPALARYGGATACVAVEAGDGSPPLLLDLGTGCRNLGERLLERYFPCSPVPVGPPPHPPGEAGSAERHGASGERLRLAVFVSHLHFDHVQGLPFFGPAIRPDVRLDIFGPLQSDSLEAAFAAFVQPPYFPIRLDEIPSELRFVGLDDGAEVEVGPARVTAREIPHVGSTLGYRVEVGGVVVAYLSDHQAPESGGRVVPTVAQSAVDLCMGADLVVHDAQYTDEEFARKRTWGHSTHEYAVEVAAEAGAARLALFHHDPTHDDAALDRIGEEASFLAGRRAPGLEVLVAAEGGRLDLAPAGVQTR